MHSAPGRVTLAPMSADTQVLESLAFLYLTFGHSTDGQLSADEMRMLATKLREWAPDAELGDIGDVLRGTVDKYKASSDKLGDAREVTRGLKGKLDNTALRRVLTDLESLAAADGQIVEQEMAFIEQTQRELGLV